MVSKILFVVLFACASVSATPINRDVAESEEKPVEHLSIVETVINEVFGHLMEQIGSAIKDSLELAFKRIGDRLDTEEYLTAIEDLRIIMEKVFDNQDKIELDESKKKVVEEQLKKVGQEFENVIKKTVEKIEKDDKSKVDAKDFRKSVDELQEVIDKILS